MTTEEIRATSFDVVRKGYNPEDVMAFQQELADEIDRLTEELEIAAAQRDEALIAKESAETAMLTLKDDYDAKMYVLAEKVEEYRGQEDILKTALINAQRMGETVVHEAKQKAEQILRESTGQAELLRQKAEREIARERETLEHILGEVNKFKTTILNLYKLHIESLSELDAPIQRAEQLLEETIAYKSITQEAPPLEPENIVGVAEPELPVTQPDVAFKAVLTDTRMEEQARSLQSDFDAQDPVVDMFLKEEE